MEMRMERGRVSHALGNAGILGVQNWGPISTAVLEEDMGETPTDFTRQRQVFPLLTVG